MGVAASAEIQATESGSFEDIREQVVRRLSHEMSQGDAPDTSLEFLRIDDLHRSVKKKREGFGKNMILWQKNFFGARKELRRPNRAPAKNYFFREVFSDP